MTRGRLTTMGSRASLWVRALITAAVAAGSLIPWTFMWAPGAAATTTPTCASAGITLTSLAGPNFYIDGGTTPAFTGSYTGYTLTNATGSALSDVWVSLSNFTGSDLGLASGQAAANQIPSLSAGASTPLYWYLTAPHTSTTTQNFSVTVYQHNPALPDTTPLCTMTDGFGAVDGTIAASANKVTGITLSTAAPNLGSAFTVTVTGNTGTIGQGMSNDPYSLWMSPSVDSAWPASAFRLVSTSLTISPDGSAAAQTYNNILRLANLGTASRDYTASYTFRAVGYTSSATNLQPVQEIASGTQVKHTGSYSASIPAITPPANNISMSLSGTPAQLGIGGGTATYTATLTGSAGETLDAFTVTPPAGASYVPGTASFGGGSVSDPVASSGTEVFTGPFNLTSSSGTLQFGLDYTGGLGDETTSIVGDIGSSTLYSAPGSTTPASFTVNVDRPPTASSPTVTVPLSAGTVNIPAATYASDPDGDALSVTAAGPAVHGQVTVTNGTVDYTPPASGTADSFPYTVSDGRGGTATGTVNITLDNLALQTITASGPTSAVADDGSVVLSGSASSGLPVTFSSNTAGVCSTDGSATVTIEAVGTCTVTVSQGGDSTYAPAVPAIVSFPVTPATQTITFPAPSGVVALGAAIPLSATASSALPVDYSTSTPTVCDVSAGSVSGLQTGSCTITATQGGNSVYGAATAVDQTFQVSAAPQTIVFPAPASLTAGSSEGLGASASSGLAVTYSTTTPAICSVDTPSATVSGLAEGTCSVTASQAGDGTWAAAASVTQSLQVAAAVVSNPGTPPTPPTPPPTPPTPPTTPAAPAPLVVNGAGGPAEVGVTYGQALTASGGTGNLSWSVPSGGLPPGIGIDPSTGMLHGTPTTAGVYTFTISVTDGSGDTAPLVETITVAPSPYIVQTPSDGSGPTSAPAPGSGIVTTQDGSTALLTLIAGQPVTVPADMAGGTGPFVWSVSGTPPAGLTMTAGGTWIGRPTTPGVYVVQLTLTDAFGRSMSQQLTIDVLPTSLNSRLIAATPDGKGYWLATSTGQVLSFGDARSFGSVTWPLHAPIFGVAATPDGKGYWLVGSDGGVFAFGDARFYGSTGNLPLRQPIMGVTATPDGKGYWLVARDGGVFAFGDAGFYGSTGGILLDAPIAGMAATPDGKGYWLVARDGGVFAFGDARFHGSMHGHGIAAPMVGMAAAPDGAGYWLAGQDGGVFAFGTAVFHGSLVGTRLNQPIDGIQATTSGNGYWMAGADGGVFALGDAPFVGSQPTSQLSMP